MRSVGDINECDFVTDETCQHLKNLHNSVNHYFPNDHVTKLCIGKRSTRSLRKTKGF